MTEALATRLDTPTDPIKIGGILAKSGFFDDARQEAQAVAKVLAGQELGIPPVAAMTGIHIVKGNVTLSANLIAGLIKRSGRYDYRAAMSAESVTVTFLEGGTSIGESTFSMADARRAGLAGAENWQKYPANMLFARAISNGAKWYCPDVFAGAVYTPDELGAEVDGESGEVVEVPGEPSAGSEPEPVDAEVVDEPEPTLDPARADQILQRAGEVVTPQLLQRAVRHITNQDPGPLDAAEGHPAETLAHILDADAAARIEKWLDSKADEDAA